MAIQSVRVRRMPYYLLPDIYLSDSDDQYVSSVLSQAVMLLLTTDHEIFFAGDWACLAMCGEPLDCYW